MVSQMPPRLRRRVQPGIIGVMAGGDPDLEALARDVERLHVLTRPHVADGDDDLSQAVARIPGPEQRREAAELLARVKSVRGSRLDGLAG